MNSVRHLLAALASAGLLTACGGGGSDTAVALDMPTSTSFRPTSVQVEGCVQSGAHPARAATVHARGEDGRLLATAASDERGVYVLQLPAQQSVALSTEAAGPAELVVLTGRGNFSIGGCLRRDAA